MINYDYPVSGKVLRGGKGLIARSHKTILYVRTPQNIIDAKKKYGNKCKIVLFPNLEDMR